MSLLEIIFWTIIAMSQLIIATEWAKNGLWEIGIQRPINVRALIGLFVGTGTFLIAGLANRYYEFNPSATIGFYIPVVALLWMLFYRYVLMPAGQFNFNRARTRMNYWMVTGNYIPGQHLKDRADSLKEFGFAQNAVKLFKKAITAQKKGNKVWHITKTITLTDDMISGWGNTYRIRCPACLFELDIPMVNYQNMSGTCGSCGNITTARIEGQQLYLNTMLYKPIHTISDHHHYNIAVAYEELGFLYRMMGLFNKAKTELQTSMEMVEELLGKDSTNKSYLALKSLVIFRLAEIAHVQDNLQEAKTGYEKSLVMDQTAGNQEGIDTNTILLQQLKNI